MIHRLIIPLALLAVSALAGAASAQNALPGRRAPLPSGACMDGLTPLRQEAEKRGLLVKDASRRHASPDEACRLIGSYSQAEAKLIEYAETCAISRLLLDTLEATYRTTEILEKRVCGVAMETQKPWSGDPPQVMPPIPDQ